jgi:glycolate oxidase iron-sulfur subunit
MRSVHLGGAPPDDSFVTSMDTCVQCRGCETACPSGVPFGHLMEGTRETLVAQVGGYQPWWRRLAYRSLGHHSLLLAASTGLGVAQRLRLTPRSLPLPTLPLRRPRLRPTGDDVWLFTGCVMDAWQRRVHVAAVEVLGSLGLGVALPGRGGACCGALSEHAGLGTQARTMAERVMASCPGDAPILVDSAGCGAQMKEYGRLLGTPEADRFTARVFDIHEWLERWVDDLPPGELTGPVAVQDPCHLRHAQRVHLSVRTLLSRYGEIVELDDEGLCCGAGGAFAALHPELAGPIRDRKVAAIVRSGAAVVASANPGCTMHLATELSDRSIDVRHPIELVAAIVRRSPGSVR